MTKRESGKFERRARDFYRTPGEAVKPLLMHLIGHTVYDEPCAGDLALVEALSAAGHAAAGLSDIEQRHPAVKVKNALQLVECEGDIFITNPPWPSPGKKGQPTIGIIQHLVTLAPVWMLLPADFAHNVYFAALRCRAIQAVGRVSWMDNGIKGFDNCAWYLFDQNASITAFYPRNLDG